MLDIFSRHRTLSLLAVVVLAQILLLAFQIKREHDVRLIRYWAAELVTPGERAATWSLSKSGSVWNGYIALHRARVENERLRAELDRLRIHNRELETQAGEAQRLRALLGLHDAHAEAPMLAAQVIGASADASSHTLFINRGERDHIRRNMAVITPDGIVGKIVEVLANNTSQVLLLSDKDSGVGALFADTRTHGVLKGTGDPEPRLEYVVNDEPVHPGEVLLTSGDDRIFPKGLVIGTVTDAAPGNPFQVIHVRPAARLDRLEDVLILLSQHELIPQQAEESTDTAEANPVAPGIVPPLPAPPKTAPAASTGTTFVGPKPPARPAGQTSSATGPAASTPKAPTTAPAPSTPGPKRETVTPAPTPAPAAQPAPQP
ncbi:MAG: rod shape-determining protein MreC [Acidobacteriia bacterium]|nr:rod shape-determining protein MreC [Terriglobia bacterium]